MLSDIQRDVLFFTDPKVRAVAMNIPHLALLFTFNQALHHIFKSGYSYSRTTDSKFISWMLMGESVLFTDREFSSHLVTKLVSTGT